MNNRGLLWTREEIEQLRTELNAGLQLDEIAPAHGRSPYAILGRMRDLGWVVQLGDDWHRVNPEPWVLGSTVERLQREDREMVKKGEL